MKSVAESPIKLFEWVNHFQDLLDSHDNDTRIDIHCEVGKIILYIVHYSPRELPVEIWKMHWFGPFSK